MLKIILLSILSFASVAECLYTTSLGDIEANWTAFKTPEKLGVKGRFKELGLVKPKLKAKSIKELLEGQAFTIDTRSVWTRNTGRDAKIVKFFFSNLGDGFKIPGKVKAVKRGKIQLELTFNAITKTIPLKIKENESSFTATGYIDVLDFNLGKSLNAINKACSALHQGKTWSDVELELRVSFDKKCS